MSLPSLGEIVVIGGGIIGCSPAFRLAREHKADGRQRVAAKIHVRPLYDPSNGRVKA